MTGKQHIHCAIENCHYYSAGNKCTANEILVHNDQFCNSQPDHVDAPMASQITPASAESCMSTACKSFVPKGSDKVTADGIKKMQ
ncbi:DUF1540 domain-containing protein [Heliobacterium chlorum]|uniref:DUF1540 domain-containing protein n=1 Tax=Heliobacterium chlorum TaxID=2698 RepID=A0ABR7T5U6_HELCL|nr:DUF1540 domain-containing protein [Heliobacterium chlorum]MBC9786154.1 DUF1540 domain-containing protein [Heliobacterium chlorum]